MTDDQIREIWLAVTGVDEPAVAWDVIGFGRAIEQASRRAALEELLQRIPTTPEQMIDFIGSNFDSMQADGWTDTLPSKPTGDLNMVRYSLTVHDLLSAFEWSDLSAEAIRALTSP